MIQFQVPPRTPPASQGQLPALPPAGRLNAISIHQGSEITLELVGPTVRDLTISTSSSALVLSTPVLLTNKKVFKVRATGTDTALLKATDSAGSVKADAAIVAGEYVKHHDADGVWPVDLLADVSRGSNATLIDAVRRMLRNEDGNLFRQQAAHNYIPKYGNLTCGIVCKERSEFLFGQVSPIDYENPYHEPLSGPVADRRDVRYNQYLIFHVTNVITSYLYRGIPVRVGVLDSPVGMFVDGDPARGKGTLVAYREGGHTVVIVGRNERGDKFLYIDPWKAGSQMVYKGGLVNDRNPNPCLYLGVLELRLDPSRERPDDRNGVNIIRQTRGTEGTFNTGSGTYLEVVSGPPLPRAVK